MTIAHVIETDATPDGVTTPPALPAIECVSWCEDQDGHTDAGDPDDQWCSRVTSISS